MLRGFLQLFPDPRHEAGGDPDRPVPGPERDQDAGRQERRRGSCVMQYGQGRTAWVGSPGDLAAAAVQGRVLRSASGRSSPATWRRQPAEADAPRPHPDVAGGRPGAATSGSPPSCSSSQPISQAGRPEDRAEDHAPAGRAREVPGRDREADRATTRSPRRRPSSTRSSRTSSACPPRRAPAAEVGGVLPAGRCSRTAEKFPTGHLARRRRDPESARTRSSRSSLIRQSNPELDVTRPDVKALYQMASPLAEMHGKRPDAERQPAGVSATSRGRREAAGVQVRRRGVAEADPASASRPGRQDRPQPRGGRGLLGQGGRRCRRS